MTFFSRQPKISNNSTNSTPYMHFAFYYLKTYTYPSLCDPSFRQFTILHYLICTNTYQQPHFAPPFGLYCIVFYCIVHFYSASNSLSLSEALPTTAIDTVSEFTSRSAIGNCR